MFALEELKDRNLILLVQILKKIFRNPILATIEGDWKTGKTDCALFFSEVLLENDIIDEVSTNIHTEGHYQQISDIQNLKYWLHRNNKRKLYIFDELNENLPSRRAMSNKSVDIIGILPECSKARARVLGLAQDIESVDSTFRKKVWSKAFFRKFQTRESKVKNLAIISPFLLKKRYEFFDIPKTSIHFNPYLLAPFTEKPSTENTYLDEDLNRYSRWANGVSWKDNGFKHPEEANRFYVRVSKKLLGLYSQFTLNSVEGIEKEKE